MYDNELSIRCRPRFPDTSYIFKFKEYNINICPPKHGPCLGSLHVHEALKTVD